MASVKQTVKQQVPGEVRRKKNPARLERTGSTLPSGFNQDRWKQWIGSIQKGHLPGRKYECMVGETGQVVLGTRRNVNSLEGNLIVEVKFL